MLKSDRYPGLYSITEVSKLINKTRQATYRYLKYHKIKTYVIGDRFTVVRTNDLEEVKKLLFGKKKS